MCAPMPRVRLHASEPVGWPALAGHQLGLIRAWRFADDRPRGRAHVDLGTLEPLRHQAGSLSQRLGFTYGGKLDRAGAAEPQGPAPATNALGRGHAGFELGKTLKEPEQLGGARRRALAAYAG